ncbi:FG-GAP and VCBS repeat-containing protein [Granulosicoccus sp. 3-233]|uniref:FG-GAP and VCBS repeat-containing protein n=1 Tax=Granulosicoccus sp. 3-233 TaxID=3417969 RepID=UPI003D33B9F3
MRNPILALVSLVTLLFTNAVMAQGTSRDNGHAATGGQAIFAAWNERAGDGIPEDLRKHSEFLPNLNGWDFRINLPFTTFRQMTSGRGSGPVLAGVLESSMTSPTVGDYGHINNSLWVFQVFDTDRKLRFKLIPSRRNLPQNTVDNARSLQSGWRTVPGPDLRSEQPAVSVVGEGLGATTIFVAARDATNTLQFTSRDVTTSNNSNWGGQWIDSGVVAASAPSLAQAEGGNVAMAWRDLQSQRIGLQVFSPSTDSWTGTVLSIETARGRPQLIWDGVSLNVFYVHSRSGLLKHSIIRTDPTPQFEISQTVMPLVSVKDDDFDVIVFNQRFHVAARHDAGGGPTRLFYTVARSQFGQPSSWASFSDTTIVARGRPEIAFVNDNIFVIGVGEDGRVRYSRKDPNSRGNELTGAALADRWLQAGRLVDRTSGFRSIDTVSFNSDIYLAGIREPSDDAGTTDSSHIMNFSRAAMKNFLVSRLGIRLLWGESGAGISAAIPGGFANFKVGPSQHPFLPESGEIPLLGDVTGDGMDDLIKFSQEKINDQDGPAPVHVASATAASVFSAPQRWHRFFSLKGEIPLVGDFNGDGKDDIVTFVQSAQKNADGTPIGPAPVWVSLSDGSQFGRSRVWHKFFSLEGETPMVGDFNGDGKDDIATFVQSAQKDAAGTPIGPAPVWVALSDGTKFLNSRVWHRFFSLKGEIPLIGDFNGDDRDDIATFVQKRQNKSDGSILGNAPVWVSLSDGRQFSGSRVWHTFFSLKGEVPRIGDLNADGLDDIVTFVNDQPKNQQHKQNVYVAFSNGSRFERSTIHLSNFGSESQLPLIGSTSGQRLSAFTDKPDDVDKLIPAVVAFSENASVQIARSLGNTTMPSGAPWENYKWFTEKGIGTAMFPTWIWNGSKPCLAGNHRFVLLGASGSGGGSVTNHSVRMGGREGHVLQEVGHSIFANCFRENNDVFNQWKAIFQTEVLNGQPGFNSNAMLMCPGSGVAVNIDILQFLDCRDPEHYFLGFMVRYRVEPERFRQLIAATNEPLLTEKYNWLKVNWFEGTEFADGIAANANFAEVGVKLLP